MSNNIVQFNEEIIKGQIKELVRSLLRSPYRTVILTMGKLLHRVKFTLIRNHLRQNHKLAGIYQDLIALHGDGIHFTGSHIQPKADACHSSISFLCQSDAAPGAANRGLCYKIHKAVLGIQDLFTHADMPQFSLSDKV